MHLYLADWKFDGEAWVSPFPGTLSALDVSYGSTRLGIFATRDPQTGLLLGEKPDAIINRADFESAFALGERLVAGELGAAIWEIFSFQSDPLRVERPRPIMPTSRGDLNLWIGGQKWGTKRFSLAEPEWPSVQKNIQLDYRRIRQAVLDGKLPDDHHRRILSKLMRKYRTEDHTLFIPPDLPNEEPIAPRTTVSDDFNRANENLEDSANWSLLQKSNGLDSSYVVNSNVCRPDDNTNANDFAQHQTALSTDDHFAEIDIASLTAPSGTRSYGGPMVRCHGDGSSKAQGYSYQATIDNVSAIKGRLIMLPAGGQTTLIDEAETISLNDTIECEADGSDITGKINGATTAGPTTDTTYSGQLQLGLDCRIDQGVAGDIELDNFSGGDLAAGGATSPWYYYAQQAMTWLMIGIFNV